MIYPSNFETKIGFTEIRSMLKAQCLSTLGKEQVDSMVFSDKYEEIREWLAQVSEFRRARTAEQEIPMEYFLVTRRAVARLRAENTYLE